MALIDILAADTTDAVRVKMNAAIEAIAAISGEPTRAQAAESSLATAIAGKADQASLVQAAASLQGNLNGLATVVGGKADQTSLTAETSRAEGSEAALVAALAAGDKSNADAIAAEMAARTRAVSDEALARQQGDQTNAKALSAETVARKQGDQDAASVLADETTARQRSVSDLGTRIGIIAANLAAARSFATYRPGDAPELFTSSLSGLSPIDPVQGETVPSPRGSVYLLKPGAIMAVLQAIWLEPEAFFALRFLLRRAVDPNSRAPGAQLGVQWLDALGAPISTSSVRFFRELLIADGMQLVTARVPSTSPDALDLTPPAGAVFFRPFVADFSRDGTLAVSSLTVSDVTNAGVYAPDVADLAARILAIESRLGQFGG